MDRKFMVVPIMVGALALGACAEEPAEDVGVAEEVGVEPALAPAEPVADAGIGEWDADSDTRLAANEFRGWTEREGFFNTWNTNADAGLDENEFGEGAFGIWDANDDAGLDENEFNEGIGWFGEGADVGTFGDWDLNDDARLDTNEFNEGFRNAGVFGEWDRNTTGLVETDEFEQGLFGLFDENEDTFVDESEWGAEYNAWRS